MFGGMASGNLMSIGLWFGANAEKSLLCYWTKFIKKCVSILFHHDKVEHWYGEQGRNMWSFVPFNELALRVESVKNLQAKRPRSD
jgi:hypothetical protein